MHILSFPKEKSKRLVSQIWNVLAYSFPPFLFTPLFLCVLFIYLVALGLSCGHMGSSVFVAACVVIYDGYICGTQVIYDLIVDLASGEPGTPVQIFFL